MTFRPPWWGIILCVLGVGLFTKLGIWQWHRAQEKEALLSAQASQAQQTVLFKEGMQLTALQRIRVTGAWDNAHTMLLDNQFFKHQVGYDVLVPLKLSSGKYLLVDRGWVAASSSRDKVPVIAQAIERPSMEGAVYYPSEKNWTLSQVLENPGHWPLIVEKIEFATLATELKAELYPFVLRLDADDPNAYVRDWRVVTMKPAQHRGYAFQWFAMALAVLIIFIVLNMERHRAAV